MTIIYSNGQTLSSLHKGADDDFHYQHYNQYDKSQFTSLLKTRPTTNEDQRHPNFKDLCTLSSMMARQIDNLGWQLRVLSATDETEIDSDQMTTIDEELVFFHTRLEELQQHLQQVINDMTLKKVNTFTGDIKVNLGGGSYTLPGWINVDASHSDISYNVLWGLPFANDSVDYIYCAYLFEHLRYQDDALHFLQEIKRVLKPGGVLRLCLPHIKPYMQAYVNGDHAFFKHVETRWGFSFGGTCLEKVLNYAGVGHKLGVLDDHKFGYDQETLEQLLTQVNFTQFYASSFMKSLYKELMIDHNDLAAETYCGQTLSLIYEAVK